MKIEKLSRAQIIIIQNIKAIIFGLAAKENISVVIIFICFRLLVRNKL